MWGTFLSEPLRIAALVVRYTANQLILRMPIPYRPKPLASSRCRKHATWGINPGFPGLSPCKGQVAYALRTRAPLSPKGPYDLHVLGLPLAFILSQDQTLHCKVVFNGLKPFLFRSGTRCLATSGYFRHVCFSHSTSMNFPAHRAPNAAAHAAPISPAPSGRAAKPT